MPAVNGGIAYSVYRAITPGDTSANNFVGPNNIGQSQSAPNVLQNAGAALCDAIYVGSIGGGATVTVVLVDGTTQAFTCIAGEILPVKAIRVNATGTLASSLVALYF